MMLPEEFELCFIREGDGFTVFTRGPTSVRFNLKFLKGEEVLHEMRVTEARNNQIDKNTIEEATSILIDLQ